MYRVMNRYEKLELIPYQETGDSPTVKTYTQWSLFEPYIRKVLVDPENSIATLKEVHEDCSIGKNVVYVDANRYLVNIGRGDHYKVSKLAIESETYLKRKIEYLHYISLDKILYLNVGNSGWYKIVFDTSVINNPKIVYVPQHIIVDINKELDIVLEVVIKNDSYPNVLKTRFIEINVGEYSRVNVYLKMNSDSNGPPHYLNLGINLSKGSRVDAYTLLTPSLMNHVSYRTRLMGENSEFFSRNILFGYSKGKIDLINKVIHSNKNTISRIYSTGLSLDRACLIDRGISRVEEHAIHSKTVYNSEIVVLDEESCGYSSPSLEIATGIVDDARHNVKVEKPLDEQIFYLMTRGLPRLDALKLITYGLMTKDINVENKILYSIIKNDIMDLLDSEVFPRIRVSY